MTAFIVFAGLLCCAFVTGYVIRNVNRRKLAVAVAPKLDAFRLVSNRFGPFDNSVTDSYLIEWYGRLLLKFDDPHEAALENWVRLIIFRLPFEELNGEVYYRKSGLPKETKLAPITDEEVLKMCGDFKLETISDLAFEGVIAREIGKKYIDRMDWLIKGYILESGQSMQAVPGFQMFIKKQIAKMGSTDSGFID